jgi:hypothetical protein
LQNNGVKTFLSTTGYDRIGHVSFELFNIDGFVANPIVWFKDDEEIYGSEIVYRNSDGSVNAPLIEENAKVKGCIIPIKGPEDKRKANETLVKKFGLNKENVAIVENDYLGHPSMKTFFPIASPLADEETVKLAKELGGLQIEDYRNADELLRKFQLKKLSKQ